MLVWKIILRCYNNMIEEKIGKYDVKKGFLRGREWLNLVFLRYFVRWRLRFSYLIW